METTTYRSQEVVPEAPAERAMFCSLPASPPREFGPEVNAGRAALIISLDRKWVNGTVLRYYFFDNSTDGQNVVLRNGSVQFRTWTAPESQKQVVRAAFKTWKDLGIGLEFKEVDTRDEAEIRIGFMQGDGSWSYIGRDILHEARDERTMNFGWSLTTHPSEIDTAIHEIGHTLGFPHEHQNPNAGIVWDEEAVYTALAKPPNEWTREETFHNIISKIRPDSVQGSNWDPNSVMHYPFEAGLIREPADFQSGLRPAGGLSERDKTWARTFYPPLAPASDPELKPGTSSPLNLNPGQQANYSIKPTATRRYNLGTFGISDTVIVLFEDVNGELRHLASNDDSGTDLNARLNVKLFSGKKYVLRVRLYYADRAGETSVMMW